MSPRSIRRAHARRIAQDQRRALLRRRRQLAAGAIGAAALMAAPANAANFVVTQTTDAAPDACDVNCTLRDALTIANTNGEADTITFADGLSSRILLTQGPLPISEGQDLTITGPGRGILSISGDKNDNGLPDAGDSPIFNITAPAASHVAISGLTLTHGYNTSSGGAIESTGLATLAVSDSAITNSKSDSGGGGVYVNGDFNLSSSTVSGNTGSFAGGLDLSSSGSTAGDATISDSTISDNKATGSPGSRAGGIDADGLTLLLQRSTVSGNTAVGSGGGLTNYTKYGLTIDGSTFSGNSATFGGGMLLGSGFTKYGPVKVSDTTVSGNQATHGAGITVSNTDAPVTISRSTISGNDGGANSWGGGLLLDSNIAAAVRLVDSTVSGNTATAGGGVSIGSEYNNPVLTANNGAMTGSISFENSTISGNAATAHGGGIYLSQYDSGNPPVKKSGSASITSTIVAGNTAAGAGQDLDRVDTSTAGGFDGAFSLVQVPGDAPLTQQSMLIGIDPQLGALGDHGGPTATMVPAGTSPVIDQGRSPARLTVDQRNAPRLVDTGIPNPPQGDGTDIGAVELAADQVVLPPPPPKATFAVTVRGLPISPGTPLLPASTTPLDCAVTVVTMGSCKIELRSKSSTKVAKKTTVAKGTLLAEGVATSASGATRLSVKVKLTSDGKAVLKALPVGVDTIVAGEAAPDTTSALTTAGVVHLLAGPSVTLGVGKRSAKLPKTVTKRLDELAKLIPSTKTVSCTAYSDKGKGDVTLTKKQASAACSRLVKDGVKGKVTSTGKGHVKPVASNRTKTGRAMNRRIVITFTL